MNLFDKMVLTIVDEKMKSYKGFLTREEITHIIENAANFIGEDYELPGIKFTQVEKSDEEGDKYFIRDISITFKAEKKGHVEYFSISGSRVCDDWDDDNYFDFTFEKPFFENTERQDMINSLTNEELIKIFKEKFVVISEDDEVLGYQLNSGKKINIQVSNPSN